MMGFVASNLSKYDLLRQRLLAKYPRTINLLLMLVLIAQAGLSLYLLSDLASFASDPDHMTFLESIGGERDALAQTIPEERDEPAGGNLSQGNLSNTSVDANLSDSSQLNGSISISEKEEKISSEEMNSRKTSSSGTSSSRRSGSSSSSKAALIVPDQSSGDESVSSEDAGDEDGNAQRSTASTAVEENITGQGLTDGNLSDGKLENNSGQAGSDQINLTVPVSDEKGEDEQPDKSADLGESENGTLDASRPPAANDSESNQTEMKEASDYSEPASAIEPDLALSSPPDAGEQVPSPALQSADAPPEEIREKQSEINDRIAESKARVSSASDRLSESNDRLAESRDRVSDTNDRISQSNDRISQASDRISQSNDRVSQASDRISQSNDRVSQASDRISQSNDRLAESRSRVSEIGDRVSESKDRVSESLARAAERRSRIP